MSLPLVFNATWNLRRPLLSRDCGLVDKRDSYPGSKCYSETCCVFSGNVKNYWSLDRSQDKLRIHGRDGSGTSFPLFGMVNCQSPSLGWNVCGEGLLHSLISTCWQQARSSTREPRNVEGHLVFRIVSAPIVRSGRGQRKNAFNFAGSRRTQRLGSQFLSTMSIAWLEEKRAHGRKGVTAHADEKDKDKAESSEKPEQHQHANHYAKTDRPKVHGYRTRPARPTPERADQNVLLQAFNWESWKHKWWVTLKTTVDDLCSVGITDVWLPPVSLAVDRQVGRSSLTTETPCAPKANKRKCFSEGGESFGIAQQRPSKEICDDKKEGTGSCTDDRSAVELETRVEDAKDAGKGTCGHEEHEISEEELRAKSGKNARSKNVGRGGTSEMLCLSEEQRMEDEKFMFEALLEAKKAASVGEVPVGAVVVQNGRIIARAYNRVEAEGDPTAHAEMLCIRTASKETGDWRLTDATIYVTMEPCAMCAGALLQARVKRVVWGARNNLLGADGSWVSLFPSFELNHSVEEVVRQVHHPFHKTVEVRREILPEECSLIMRSFFRSRRKGDAPAAKRKPWWLSFECWVLFRKFMG